MDYKPTVNDEIKDEISRIEVEYYYQISFGEIKPIDKINVNDEGGDISASSCTIYQPACAGKLTCTTN